MFAAVGHLQNGIYPHKLPPALKLQEMHADLSWHLRWHMQFLTCALYRVCVSRDVLARHYVIPVFENAGETELTGLWIRAKVRAEIGMQ